MIEIKGISKSFEEIKAVDNVSVTIKEGNVFGLIGTNGAGKSTVLRMVTGVYKPDEGVITIDGLPVFDYQSLPDFAKVTLEGDKSVITNYDHKVDPRLDFIVGRPNVTWKTYDKSPCLSQWVRDRGTYGYNCNKRFVVSPESPDMYPGWPWGASALNWHIVQILRQELCSESGLCSFLML